MPGSSAGGIAAPKPHVLVVDDDPAIIELTRRYFSAHGFRVSGVTNGAAMRDVLAGEHVDLVLLDLGLPGEDGLDLTRHLHDHWRGAVIIITGRGDAVDRVVGLEIGADDYVTKPFDLRELLARVRSVLRRSEAQTRPGGTAIVRFAGFRMDCAARSLHAADGSVVALTTGEFDLLRVLVEHPNRVLSRDDLISRIHGRAAGPYDRAVDVQIGRLRRKIEADPTRPELIKSVRGAGYMLAATPRPE